MDERAALAALAELVPGAGDDAGLIDGLVFTIDMLHDRTDFPAGVTRYTAGWRSVGASLSDVAAMGGDPLAAVAAYGAPTLEPEELESFVDGAQDVCACTDADYIGGDLDTHDEFTVATAVVGRAEAPVSRSGATPGEGIYVTGTLGRTAAAMDRFEAGDHNAGNTLFQFTPRVAEGKRLAEAATAMIDASDGLARSLYQLAEASGCGMAIDGASIPVDSALPAHDDRALYFGEDFELVCTAPTESMEGISVEAGVTRIGRVTESGVTIDGRRLPDRGFDHGDG